jgi:hypothetical protein
MGNGEAETQAKASLRHMKNLVKSRETRATSRTRRWISDHHLSRKKKRGGWELRLATRGPTRPFRIGPVMPFHLIGLGLADEEVSYIRGCKHHEIPCPFEEY